MIEKYIEVEPVWDGFIFTDWTHWFQSHVEHNNYREIARQSHGWVTVVGKTITYKIRARGWNEQQCKQFAIWYHVNKASGNISTYRLD